MNGSWSLCLSTLCDLGVRDREREREGVRKKTEKRESEERDGESKRSWRAHHALQVGLEATVVDDRFCGFLKMASFLHYFK